jgi:hypothetical protein
MSAKITLMPGRGKSAICNTKPRKPGKRGACSGWTRGAVLRNADFLGSIVPEELTGVGVACSLTVLDCPPSPEAWQDARRAFIRRLERMGLVRFHWLTEWQLRERSGGGPVPHLHCILFFKEGASSALAGWVIKHWLEVTSDWRSSGYGQDAKGVTDKIQGWLQYLSKHGSRSVSNKQRIAGMIPDAWSTAGRLWGKGGDWPTSSVAVLADDRTFFLYRRLMRNHAKAAARERLRKARHHGNAQQERSALRSLLFSRDSLKYPYAPRGQEVRQPQTQAQIIRAARCRPMSGFLPDRDVFRWLQALPPSSWSPIEDPAQIEGDAA